MLNLLLEHIAFISCKVKLTYNELTARDRLFLFVITRVGYNQVNLCSKMTHLFRKYVRFNRVSLYLVWPSQASFFCIHLQCNKKGLKSNFCDVTAKRFLRKLLIKRIYQLFFCKLACKCIELTISNQKYFQKLFYLDPVATSVIVLKFFL